MANVGIESSLGGYTWIVVTVIIIVTIQVLVYILGLLRRNSAKDSDVKNEAPLDPVKEKSSSNVTGGKHNKKKQAAPWKPVKTGFEHPYLASNLMGHTGKILDMDCTGDAKYLVTCSEDEPPPDPGDSGGASPGSGGSSSGSEGSVPGRGDSSPGSPEAARRTARRRRKPRAAREARPRPPTSPEPPPAPASPPVSPPPTDDGPLQRFAELNLTETELAGLLGYYVLAGEQMAALGYPVESALHPARALVYAVDFSPPPRKFDVNAREFVPGRSREDDSGRGSGSSSPRSVDSEPDSEEERVRGGVERRCARCARGFFLSRSGEYLTRERCRHHWGRLQRSTADWAWACCGGPAGAAGCSRAALHVWSGTAAGLNGPLEGFVRTRPRTPGAPRRRVLALDCEMCYTASGLQAARLEAVGADGRRVYGAFVLPDAPVVDYNTRFSGISARDLRRATKSLADVQRDLLELVDEDTILVGHGLENDLRALRLLHTRVVDTAVSFPHARGLPWRRSLRALAAQHLARPVQAARHCPLEDARASLDLMLWRVQRDFSARC